MRIAMHREISTELPAEQRAIRSRCFHPAGTWRYMDPDADGRTIHQVIEARAAAIPDETAVVSPAHILSYRALNQEANRLARAVVMRAEGADVPIAVCCSLGAAQVIAILAVFKAGRFFVSVPPSDPPERNRALIAMTGARTVIADRGNADIARALVGDEHSVLNADPTPASDERVGDLGLRVSPDALIRIAMTSGSTGEPKGIMQTHRTTLFGAIARNNAVHLCAEDKMLMATATFTELWRPLLVGAPLYLFDLKTDDMVCLRRWLDEEHPSAFRATPSVFRQLVDVLVSERSGPAESSPFASLRVVELLGEPLPAECVELFQQHFSRHCTLINFLGSKEVLDYRLFYMDHGTRISGSSVPAGYALADTRVTLLDEAGNPASRISVGEIAVESRSMSPGYWRRADLTNERFTSDSPTGARRIYRTGDLGQLMPDDCLIYLGRRDSMVKVRGHRVDLDALEQSLRALDGVGDAAVVMASTVRQESDLVAFIVAGPAQQLAERDLRRELRKRVPDFMIPSVFVFLEAMPTTPMGKTDRDALRSMAKGAPPQIAPSQSPCASIESEIATIWEEILERNQVGPSENFFELGGNSLMVMQVGFRLQRRFEIDLPLAVLFARPTVTGLAAYVREVLPVAR